MRHERLEHSFVHHIPEHLKPGVLYVSLEYGTAVHSCCCGCGEEVVTPITPTDWKITFDGETITLNPSIGNWNSACQTHYWIARSRVIEALPWSDDEIAEGRRRNCVAKRQYYGTAEHASIDTPAEPVDTLSTNTPSTPPDEIPALWFRFSRWISSKIR